jgi:hypothetical protein
MPAGAMVHRMTQGRERRKYKRFEVSFPVNFRVFGEPFTGSREAGIQGIGTRTVGRVGNVSLEGLFIEANPTRDQISRIIRARQERDRFDIEIETNLLGRNIRMMGKVVWYDINFLEDAPYHFRAGIFLDEMDGGPRQVWEKLIAHEAN